MKKRTLGYVALTQSSTKKQASDKTRKICLLKPQVSTTTIKVREDLMNENFRSIWLEATNEQNQTCLICGFYREWSNGGLLTIAIILIKIKIAISPELFIQEERFK